MINSVVLMGNLTAEPETYNLENGKEVYKFTIAIDEYKDKVSFFRIVCFDSLKNCVALLHKGDKVCVLGKLVENSYKREDGSTAYKVEIYCNKLEFIKLGGKTVEEEISEEVPF